MKKNVEEKLKTTGSKDQNKSEHAVLVFNVLDTALKAVVKAHSLTNTSVLSAVTLLAAIVLSNVHHDEDDKEVFEGVEKFCSAVKYGVSKIMHDDDEDEDTSESSDGSSGE